jgi:hypothetical protein
MKFCGFQTARIFAALLCLFTGFSLPAQTAQDPPSGASISRQLYSFSPLGAVYVRRLGMEDKNHNGVIDRGAGEGYEEFTERYGDADIGFAANGVTYGAANGRLEEPEIINHYYLNIRFKKPKETEAIENEVGAYIYANNIPLVWLADEQGTVTAAVNAVLGEGWNEREVTGDEAVRMFYKAIRGLNISGRSENPFNTGYSTLPESINNKRAYCFEIAELGFYFFSKLKMNTITLRAPLTTTVQHEIIELTDSGQKIDYLNGSSGYTNLNWNRINPLQAISQYYIAMGIKTNQGALLEKSILYDKYNISGFGNLMAYHFNNTYNYKLIITLGELFLKQNSMDITRVITTRQKTLR